MPSLRPSPRGAAALAAAALLLPLRTSAANIAPDNVNAGQRVMEPSAELRGISVPGERLRLDLRPLLERRTAIVTADYRLRNDGAGRTVDMVFVADGLQDSATVALDGAAVPAEAWPDTAPGTALPTAWLGPATTPGLRGGPPLDYHTQSRGTGALRFRLTIPPGEHDVRVRYRARATESSRDVPTLYWQLAYVLAPARRWQGFGTLDVRVDLPAGWEAASTPALRRQGDALVGRFSGIPADALALTVQQPPPDPAGLRRTAWAIIGVTLLLAVLVVGGLGRWLGRRGRTSAWALLASAPLAAAWAFVMTAALIMSRVELTGGIGMQAAWSWGARDNMVTLFAAVPAGFLAFVVFQLLAFLAARSARPT